MADVKLQAILSLKDKMTSGLKNSEKSLSRFGRVTRGIGKTILGVSAIMGGLATTAGVMAVRAGGEIEKTKIAMETLLGSTEKAGQVLRDLTEFAAITPFDLPGVQTAAKQLLAVGAASEENLIPTLKMVGDVAAGTGAPLERIILNFGQVATQGKLTGRELRDFAVNGIPLIAELADQFEVTKEEITDMVSAGEVGFDDVRDAFKRMSSEGGRFENLMEKQSATLPGIIENIKDKFGLLTRAIIGIDPEGNIAPGGLFDRFKGIAQGVLNLIETFPEKIQSMAENFRNWLKDLDKRTGVITFFKQIWEDMVVVWNENVKPALASILESLKPLLPVLQAIGVVVGTAIIGGFQVLSVTIQVVASAIENLVNWIKTVIDWFSTLNEKISGVGDNIRSGPIGTLLGGGGNIIMKALGLQSGGFAMAGKPYIVGEKGPELFIPHKSGTVIPNKSISNDVVVNITGNTVRSDSDLEQLKMAVINELNRKTQLEELGV